VDRLNARLEAGGVTHKVWPGPTGEVLGGSAESPRSSRLFVAAGDGEVRGGVWLAEQDFFVAGARERAAWLKYPVAESLVAPAFSGVPASLLLQLLREQPRLMALGLGGHEGPLARLLAGLRWTGVTVPFFARLVRPARVLRELRAIRHTGPRRLALDLLAASGLGWAGYRSLRWQRSWSLSSDARAARGEEVPSFGDWAEALWERHRSAYGLVGDRNRTTLNELYPASFAGLSRLRVRRSAEDIGWACTLRVDLREQGDERHFGRLAVGVLADGFGAPTDAAGIVGAAVDHLMRSDVDLIITNLSHPAWQGAVRAHGFLAGPSNFAFYQAPAMAKLLSTAAVQSAGLHLTRGDCDGPKWI
jgi:hypothetical protein